MSSLHPKLKSFNRACRKVGCNLSGEQLEKFGVYAETLLSWNQRFNLVSKNDASFEGLIKHFIDSLVIFKFVEFSLNAKILDIGSGNGFPAIPIKIYREDLDLTLVESIRKKTLFLQKVIENLSLRHPPSLTFAPHIPQGDSVPKRDAVSVNLKFDKIEVKNIRVENLEERYKNYFDFATAKKVAPVDEVWKLCYPYLKIGGTLLAYKGKKMEEEVKKMPKVLEKYPGELKVEEITLPEFRIKRYVVLVRKDSQQM